MNLLQRTIFRAKTGTEIVDLGSAEEYVIRFKDCYIHVLDGEYGRSVSWSKEPMTELPVRQFWIAVPPKEIGG